MGFIDNQQQSQQQQQATMCQNHHQQQQAAQITNSQRELPANGKKTKGRVRIKMEFINNKLRRYTTFSKRKTGIMKKAFELATLTGTQVMLLVASETGHVYTFATRKLQPMIISDAGKALIQTCLNSPDSDNLLMSANATSNGPSGSCCVSNDQMTNNQQQQAAATASEVARANGHQQLNDATVSGSSTPHNNSNQTTVQNSTTTTTSSNVDQRMSATGFEETELSNITNDDRTLVPQQQQHHQTVHNQQHHHQHQHNHHHHHHHEHLDEMDSPAQISQSGLGPGSPSNSSPLPPFCTLRFD